MNFIKKIFVSGPDLSTKWHIKVIFAVVALGIVVAVITYTQSLVDELIKREQRIINFYAKIYEHYSNPDSDPEDLLFFLDEVTPTISFPIIITGPKDKPLENFSQYSLNINIDSTLSYEEKKKYIYDYVDKMKSEYPPIIIRDYNGKIIQKFYYTHSELIDRLRYFPLIAIMIIGLFIIIGYLAFSNLRKHEQSKVWVGLAREAAHQLGTPLSSMLAWLEILKISKDDPQQVNDTVSEMENDVNRLNTIATRFSKIGSMPDKEITDIIAHIENVCKYFEKRLPHLGKKVEIIRDLKEPVLAEINKDLFAWVIENLLKNASEAIENRKGQVFIFDRLYPNKKIFIYVRDTGKGMTSKQKRQIFYPGFTTKKRGWGLGLSLVKRIIEEYHDGKIYVKESIPGKGTTFVIEMPIVEGEKD